MSSRTTWRRRATTLLTTAALAAAVTACGTTSDPTTDASEASGSGSSSSGSASASGSGSASASGTAAEEAVVGPVTFEGENGEVTLEQPAAAVVALEWGPVENLLSLGVEPVGIADVPGYNTWNTVVPIDEDTPDVGTRGEPSLDAVSALEPDLIVATTDLPENVIGQLEDIAPVLAVRGSDASDPLGYMEETVRTLATATGTTEAAEELLTDFEDKLAEGATAIEEAGLAGEPFTMADGYLNNGAVTIRMHTDGSFLGAIGEELGMQNAWTADGDPDYGLAATDVEGLTGLSDLDFLYASNDGFGPDPFVEGLGDNEVWNSLEFVQNGNVHRIPDGIWLFGGPAAGSAFVDAFVDAVTG